MGQIFVWTLSDVLYVIVGGLLAGAWILVSLAEWWRQAKCEHDGGVNETQACDAICRKCGKNLGFIGTWQTLNQMPDTLRKSLQAQAQRIDDTDCILSGRPWYVGA